jgi:NitT/TauT family transport system permease protein
MNHPRGPGISRFLYPLLTLAVIAVLWEAGARAADSLLIPTFSETVVALGGLAVSAQLWKAMLISNQALIVGFVIALLIGIPTGLALGRYKTANAVVNPYLTILLAVPMVGLIPLLVMSVGIGFQARVLVVIMFTIVVVIVNARAGVREVDPSLIEMARLFGASEPQMWIQVLLPAALPALMAGIRLGIGHAVTGMVIVELLLVAAGIGNLVLEFQAAFAPGELYATIVVVVLEAMLLISLADRLTRRVAPWAGEGAK